MSFAKMKKKSQTDFAALAQKMNAENKGSFQKDERFWVPQVDANGNGFAIIRFLPAPGDESSPYVKTFSHGFKNQNKWFIEECPTTIGQKCPVCEANSELWNTGVKSNQEIVRQRKRRTSYIANILVISDSKHPENEGKVFLYKFGSKIFEKVLGAINPEFEDETAINPFDLWEGANFKLKMRNVENFRNYDKSEFDDPSQVLPSDEELERLWKTEYSLQEFLQPDKFKPYDDLQQKFNQVVNPNTRAANASPATQAQVPATRKPAGAGGFTPPEAQVPATRGPVGAGDPAPAPQKVQADGDDDDFAMFSKMIEE